MCYNQTGDISTLEGTPLKLVDKFTYLGSNVESTEKDIEMRLTKAWTAINRLSIIWKSDLTDKMKRSFFQAAVTSILLYGCTTWTLTKRLEKKLDGNYTRMLRAILNKSWQQHPTRHQLYGHLPPITKTIQVRRTRHAGHCWRSRDELIRDVLLWIPTHGRAKAGRPARTYIQQLCEDTGCCPEDLPRAMNDREEWRERVRDIRATSTIWWWWWWQRLLLWTPAQRRAMAGRPARTCIQQLCTDAGFSLEDLPKAMDDREGCRERVRNICADRSMVVNPRLQCLGQERRNILRQYLFGDKTIQKCRKIDATHLYMVSQYTWGPYDCPIISAHCIYTGRLNIHRTHLTALLFLPTVYIQGVNMLGTHMTAILFLPTVYIQGVSIYMGPIWLPYYFCPLYIYRVSQHTWDPFDCPIISVHYIYTGSLNMHGSHMTAQLFLPTNIHGTRVSANNSTNNNVAFLFVSDLKIVYYNNY